MGRRGGVPTGLVGRHAADMAFTHAGTCRLIATAGDGRQVSTNVSTHVLYENTCCGTAYYPDSPWPISLSFDWDASTNASG